MTDQERNAVVDECGAFIVQLADSVCQNKPGIIAEAVAAAVSTISLRMRAELKR